MPGRESSERLGATEERMDSRNGVRTRELKPQKGED